MAATRRILSTAPVQPSMSTQALDSINVAAIAAHANGEVGIRALTDVIFDRLMPDVPQKHSLRDRVARAEIKFRDRSHDPIGEQALMIATNTTVARYGLPKWAETNIKQLHLFRAMLKSHVPQLISATSADGQLSDKMSPAEAAFVVLYLACGKLRSSDYQVSPDAWVEQILVRQPVPTDSGGLSVGTRPLRSSSMEAEIAREDSKESRAVHDLLDMAGFQQ
jgi:hypothetical protein